MKKIILTISFSILFSCSNSTENKPENIMSEDEMVNFLVDINIINSSRSFKNNSKINYYNIKDSLLYRKHKIDSAIFARSNFFYSSKPKVYLKIYSKLELKLNKIKDSLSKEFENNSNKDKNI